MPDHDFGPCCACQTPGPTVRNIMMLHKRAPQPGTGWGCLVCGLPSDGAVAVVCDACLEERRPLREACDGHAMKHGRISIGDLSGVFEHDLAKHGDEMGRKN